MNYSTDTLSIGGILASVNGFTAGRFCLILVVLALAFPRCSPKHDSANFHFRLPLLAPSSIRAQMSGTPTKTDLMVACTQHALAGCRCAYATALLFAKGRNDEAR
jgi:hypothetical protein